MKIRTRLIILTSLCILLSVSIFVGLYWLENQHAQLFKRIEDIGRIEVQTSLLRSQFHMHERYNDSDSIAKATKVQQSLHLQLNKMKFEEGQLQTYRNSLLRLNNSLSSLLTKLQEVHGADYPGHLVLESHHHLMDRLDNTILSMSEDSFKLATLAQKITKAKTHESMLFIDALLLSLTLMISLAALQTLNLFRSRLNTLETGITKVASGDTDYQIQVSDNDEIGLIAGHFNQMTQSLKESTISIDELQHEVEKRTCELEQQKEAFKELAEQDSLTGLANRTTFLGNLSSTIARCKREQSSAAVFFIDLDKFKQINDSLGHNAGDKVLIETANRFGKSLRLNDLIARIGGDEFSVIIEPLHNVHDAGELARKLIKCLNKPVKYEGRELYLNTSIGIAVYPDDGEEPLELMRNADAAMYKAKKAGGSDFHYYSKEMNQNALMWMQLEADLRLALKHKHLEVYYQPQFDIHSNSLIGIEALARWNHPEKGMIPPDQFIALAEDKGLIHELGSQVLEQACNDAKDWRSSDGIPLTLAVNISPKQLNEANLPRVIKAILDKTGFDANQLELEVTESYILQDPEDAIFKLQQLRDMNIQLALDDFGTGYSSLSYLKRLPLTKLKIDKSFVDGIVNLSEDRAISTTIIALGTSLNLVVIAEGTEEKAQIDILRKEGCHQAQGYFYGKPQSASELAANFLNNEEKITEKV
ncbi:EAL domain-containing protein [Neptuniibacter sp.]|uniref:putative bifunctional diguanylate cyclase/phosphodiesterase n=1 Tax=Neptuniibacter sp. TaxID=1962643 RepID=UPI0026038952|nr:EAL domain-containing protein [Neptuniibacter sp.]MCP4597996.1 EAL domain-containing protein [Neptuniibacter sp.]